MIAGTMAKAAMIDHTAPFRDEVQAPRSPKILASHLSRRLGIARLRIRELKKRNRRLNSRHRELVAANRRLADLACTDELTGLKNRRHFRESLEKWFDFAARRKIPISLVLADLDHFKSYNDSFGHLAGDDLLRRVATILRANARADDVVARYGGDEFVLLLPRTDALVARELVGRLCSDLERNCQILTPFTASFGIATTTLQTTERASPAHRDPSRLIENADRALYHSKGAGRNCVTHRDDLTDPRLIGDIFPRIA